MWVIEPIKQVSRSAKYPRLQCELESSRLLLCRTARPNTQAVATRWRDGHHTPHTHLPSPPDSHSHACVQGKLFAWREERLNTTRVSRGRRPDFHEVLRIRERHTDDTTLPSGSPLQVTCAVRHSKCVGQTQPHLETAWPLASPFQRCNVQPLHHRFSCPL